jgi:hypothetical protein
MSEMTMRQDHIQKALQAAANAVGRGDLEAAKHLVDSAQVILHNTLVLAAREKAREVDA